MNMKMMMTIMHTTQWWSPQWRWAFPPAQLADAELAIVLRNFPLRLVAQSFLQFMEILRNLWKGSVGRDAVWTKSSLDVIAHFSCSVCPNILAISFQKLNISSMFVYSTPSLACLSFSFHFQGLQVSMGPSQRGSVNVFLNLWVLEKMKNLYVLDVDNVNQDQSLR